MKKKLVYVAHPYGGKKSNKEKNRQNHARTGDG